MGFYRPWDEERIPLCWISEGVRVASFPLLPIYIPPYLRIQLNQQSPQSLANLLWNISFCLPKRWKLPAGSVLPVWCTYLFSNPSLIMRHEVKIPLHFQVRWCERNKKLDRHNLPHSHQWPLNRHQRQRLHLELHDIFCVTLMMPDSPHYWCKLQIFVKVLLIFLYVTPNNVYA